jgi:hypothetical protein
MVSKLKAMLGGYRTDRQAPQRINGKLPVAVDG